MKNMIRALALTGILGAAAAAAQAQVGFAVGVRTTPVVAGVEVGVPPCPGDGYIWQPGYYAGTIWYPGRWVYGGYAYGYRGPVVVDHYRAYDRDDYRRYDRNDYRFRDRDDHNRNYDHDRGEHRGWDRGRR